MVFNPSVTRNFLIVRVGSPALGPLELQVSVIIEFTDRSTSRSIGIVHPEASPRLLNGHFHRFGPASFLHDIINDASKLGPELQRGSPTCHLDSLNGLKRWQVVRFRIAI